MKSKGVQEKKLIAKQCESNTVAEELFSSESENITIITTKFTPCLEPPPFWVTPSFRQKLKNLLPTLWEPSKLVDVNCIKHFKTKILPFLQYEVNPNLGGLFRGLFWGGGGGEFTPPPPYLNLDRIKLETWNLVYKYRDICSFRKYTF